ncbi:MAG: TIGR02996 domain-containing protein [Kofleriaceae bacterium]
MSREHELLAQIRATPDDDGPRAIVADVLAERGDPRGEFIHLQLENSDDDERDTREELLLRRFARQWSHDAGVRDARVSFRRGFPVALAGSPETLLASEAALITQPITELILDEVPFHQAAQLRRLIEHPALERIRRLRIAPGPYDQPADGLVRLWRSDLPALRTLELSARTLSDSTVSALVEAPWFAQLERLALDRVPITPSQLPRMFDALPKLQALDLRAMRVGPAVASRLAGIRAPLTRLYLDATELTVDGARAIFGSPIMRNLERLAIGHDHLQLSVDTLAAQSYLGRLRMLGLFEARLAPADAQAIATGPFEELVELNLTGNNIGAAGARALAESETLRSVTALYLTANTIGADALDQFRTRSGLPALAKLGGYGTIADEPWAETKARFDRSAIKLV